MEKLTENDFPVSACVDEGSVPVRPCTSTPPIRECSKSPNKRILNEGGITRSLFDEKLPPLGSDVSGSEESDDDLEQIGAESISVADVPNQLPPTTTFESFPALPTTSTFKEDDAGDADDPGKVNYSGSETEADRYVAPKRQCCSPHRYQTPSPTSSSPASSHVSYTQPRKTQGHVIGARCTIRVGRRSVHSHRGTHYTHGKQPQQVCHDLFNFEWEDGESFDPEPLVFDSMEAGVQPEFPCTATSSVLQFFTAFFDQAVMQYLVQEINCYREISVRWLQPLKDSEESKTRAWTDVTVEELYVWLALTMLMPHVKKHTLKDYWITDDLISTPSFAKWMPRDRYLLILQYLHFTNSYGPQPNDRLWKLRTILEMIRGKMRTFFLPFQKVMINESLILSRGWLSCIQDTPPKGHHFGIKYFVICDCLTGYVLDFLVHSGSDVDIPSSDPHGFSGAVVKALMENYFNKNHILYTDNYYTSPALSHYLLEQKTGSCGTVHANRKQWPAFPARTKKGDIIRKKSGKMLALLWHNKRKVNMLTTAHQGAMVDSGKKERGTGRVVYKPDAVVDYNVNMRLVDKSDMMVAEIDCLKKCCKWYKKAILHLLDMTVLNAHILYQHLSKTKPSLRVFEKELVKQILEHYGAVQATCSRRHVPERHIDRLKVWEWMSRHKLALLPPQPSGRKGSRRCHVCFNTTQKEPARKETQYWCLECRVPLCPGCYSDYHSQQNF